MQASKYYIRDKNEIVSSAELFELRHFVRDEDALRSIGIFPVYEDKPSYNWLEQKLVADKDLTFDEDNQRYVETYKIVPLPEFIKVTMRHSKQQQDNASRKEEILRELDNLDAKSARSMRAILSAQVNGTEPNSDDIAMIRSLEQEAVTLRTELKAIDE